MRLILLLGAVILAGCAHTSRAPQSARGLAGVWETPADFSYSALRIRDDGRFEHFSFGSLSRHATVGRLDRRGAWVRLSPHAEEYGDPNVERLKLVRLGRREYLVAARYVAEFESGDEIVLGLAYRRRLAPSTVEARFPDATSERKLELLEEWPDESLRPKNVAFLEEVALGDADEAVRSAAAETLEELVDDFVVSSAVRERACTAVQRVSQETRDSVTRHRAQKKLAATRATREGEIVLLHLPGWGEPLIGWLNDRNEFREDEEANRLRKSGAVNPRVVSRSEVSKVETFHGELPVHR